MNYYPFHLGDYAAHTAHLEPMEDLAYRRMLDLYYRTEIPLPSDWRDIARLIRMKDHGQAIESVLSEFFDLTDAGWSHARCDAEIAKMHDKQAKARASAQASVEARSANAKRTLSERSTDVELPTPTPIPKKRNTPPPPTGGAFARFWEAWPKHPRKVARPQCERKWRSTGCDAMADQILTALEAAKRSEDWRKDDGGFIPSPLVWLNQARWEAPTKVELEPVGPDIAEQTRAMLEAKRLTPEEKAASEAARLRVMAAVKRVA